jgi:hypothetical protein
MNNLSPFPTCDICDCELEYEECLLCGGDGYLDKYDDDPLVYEPGELIECPDCYGGGGWWLCPNAKAHVLNLEGSL